jgi:DNA-binding transcriptional ArsR family regulator
MSDTCNLLCLDLDVAERVRREQRSASEVSAIAERAKGLGDPTRLSMAFALAAGGELCVCDLAWVVGRDERLVSHHARALRTAGLATSRRDGKMVLYSLSDEGARLVGALAGEPVG